MRRRYIVLCIITLLISKCTALNKGFADYNPQVYPDSLVDFGLCRLTEPSLVCDPNFLLNEQDHRDGILLLHEATQKILFNTQCVCDSSAHGSCVHKTRGYPISVAVLNKVRGSMTKKENSSMLIGAFAKVLRRRLNRGQCDEDMLIVYSVEDQKVFTVLGSVAKQKLDPRVVFEVENLARSKHFNNQNYTAGLSLMIDIYGRVFMGEPYNEALPPVNEGGFSNGLKKIMPKWPTWLIVLLVIGLPMLVIIFIVICASLFAFRRHFQRTHRYEMGRRVA